MWICVLFFWEVPSRAWKNVTKMQEKDGCLFRECWNMRSHCDMFFFCYDSDDFQKPSAMEIVCQVSGMEWLRPWVNAVGASQHQQPLAVDSLSSIEASPRSVSPRGSPRSASPRSPSPRSASPRISPWSTRRSDKWIQLFVAFLALVVFFLFSILSY